RHAWQDSQMGRNKSNLMGWVVVFGTVAASVVASKATGLSPKWEHVLVYTVLVFVASTMALHPASSRPFFWQGLGVVFLVHVIAISKISFALPPESRGIRGIPLIVVGMVES